MNPTFKKIQLVPVLCSDLIAQKIIPNYQCFMI